MRDDFIQGIAVVNGWLEDLHALASDARTAQPPDQFLALAGKHRPAHHFDPSQMARNDIHTREPVRITIMRKPVLAGNWKMYKNAADTSAFLAKLAPLVASVKHADVVICPPFVNLTAAAEAARSTNIEIGAQDV